MVLVTGATDGIGRETALAIARRGARVIPHGRSAERLSPLSAELATASGSAPLEPLVLDLARLADVREAGRVLDARGVKVDVLVNNAGVFMREPLLDEEGLELTFKVNHLAPFALTHALLRSAAGAGLARVVNVSSVAHTRGDLRLDDLSFTRRGFDGYATYAASKLANVLFSSELARRLGKAPTVNSLHPGVVGTKLLKEGFGMGGRDSLADGARTSVRLALDEDVATTTGAYFVDGKVARASKDDPALARAFYEKSAELAGVEAFAAPAD